MSAFSSGISERPLEVPAAVTVEGPVRLPPSKSVSHRYLTLAMLSGKPTRIDHLLHAEDTALYLAALEAMGWSVTRTHEESLEDMPFEDISVDVALSPPPGVRSSSSEISIECGNAGTFYRFAVAALLTQAGRFRVNGTSRLRERPIGRLVSALRELGGAIDYLGEEGYGPLGIQGASASLSGLPGGRAQLDATESSQYVSAVLMASLRAREPVELTVDAVLSAPYIEITRQAIDHFGAGACVKHRQVDGSNRYYIEPADDQFGRAQVRVEGDWSAAGYPAAAALLTGGRVTLLGLQQDSAQGDRRILDLLASAGASVTWQGATGSESVVVAGGELRAFGEVDLGDVPDQVPTVAAVAAFAPGTTNIVGVPHLRLKESDRLAAMARELSRCGVSVEERSDGLLIHGNPALAGEPVLIDTWNDHRIAMSLALVGLRRAGVHLARPHVVSKSYPVFYRHMERLTHARFEESSRFRGEGELREH